MNTTHDPNALTLDQMPDLLSDAKEWAYRIFIGHDNFDASVFESKDAAGMAVEAVEAAGYDMDADTREAVIETLTDAIVDEL